MIYKPGIYFNIKYSNNYCQIVFVQVDEHTFDRWETSRHDVVWMRIIERYFAISERPGLINNNRISLNQYEKLYSTIDEMMDDVGREKFFGTLFDTWGKYEIV